MKTHSTNYYNTFITIAEDSKASAGTPPPVKEGKKTIANYQFEMLQKKAFALTSDEVLFEIYVLRNDIADFEKAEAKKHFFSKGQACLRTSPLAKTYGWGIYFNENGKIQLIDSASEAYQKIILNKDIKKIPAMKSKKS